MWTRWLTALVLVTLCLGALATVRTPAPALAPDDGAPTVRIALTTVPGLAVPGADQVLRWPAPAGASADGVLEVLADSAGIVAYRRGEVGRGADGSAVVVSWRTPDGDAVALAGSWWALARPVEVAAQRRPDPARLAALEVDLVDAVLGDVDGDGTEDVVLLFRRPFRPTAVSAALPQYVRVDEQGNSLHLGLYHAADLHQKWVAGTLFRPVSALAACDGALALAFASGVDAADRVALGAVAWGGFGFVTSPHLTDLPGGGTPACADVDGDGRTEPLAVERVVP